MINPQLAKHAISFWVVSNMMRTLHFPSGMGTIALLAGQLIS